MHAARLHRHHLVTEQKFLTLAVFSSMGPGVTDLCQELLHLPNRVHSQKET